MCYCNGLLSSLESCIPSRSLERLLSCQETKLAGGDDAAEPEAAECARVEAIVAEADSPEYWFAASRDGNRESHYRGKALPLQIWKNRPNLMGWSIPVSAGFRKSECIGAQKIH